MRLLLPPSRFNKWVDNFRDRHGQTHISASAHLVGTAADGSSFIASLPFDRDYSGPTADLADFLNAASPPPDWGVLLVRKSGFLIARLSGAQIMQHKISRRYVQGRTKAGGQSQQRFARRRENQARAAYLSAAEAAVQILADVPLLTMGGDRRGAAQVKESARLTGHLDSRHLDMSQVNKKVLDQAICDATSVELRVTNADGVSR
jgi:hypothetical protein